MQLSPNQKLFCEFFFFFFYLFCIFGIYMKYGILWKKKDEPRSLLVSEIKDYKKRGYLNPQKAMCHNTYGQWTC